LTEASSETWYRYSHCTTILLTEAVGRKYKLSNLWKLYWTQIRVATRYGYHNCKETIDHIQAICRPVDRLIIQSDKVAVGYQAEYNEDQLPTRYSKYHPKMKHRFILPDDKFIASQSGHSTTASFSSGINQHNHLFTIHCWAP
jgi:hypothetical protein